MVGEIPEIFDMKRFVVHRIHPGDRSLDQAVFLVCNGINPVKDKWIHAQWTTDPDLIRIVG
ncbi:hypothetical protein BGP75_12695 [Motiliproteus sp. MSK22-1]|nr:hypothetical protein BGP75_12695 [Motiliproteus sp. MSK22-1]